MSYRENDKLKVSFKEENCDIVQNDIVQAVIIVICLQNIYKEIQNSEKKKLVLVEKTFA